MKSQFLCLLAIFVLSAVGTPIPNPAAFSKQPEVYGSTGSDSDQGTGTGSGTGQGTGTGGTGSGTGQGTGTGGTGSGTGQGTGGTGSGTGQGTGTGSGFDHVSDGLKHPLVGVDVGPGNLIDLKLLNDAVDVQI